MTLALGAIGGGKYRQFDYVVDLDLEYSWAVMPRVSQALRFWLRPAYRLTALKTNLIGTSLVFAALGLMANLFNYLT